MATASPCPYNSVMERRLGELRGIGTKMLEDFALLGITGIQQLQAADANQLYLRMCALTGTRQDPCVLDTYRCAIEQARNPGLPEDQRNWWYWSRLRKAGLLGEDVSRRVKPPA